MPDYLVETYVASPGGADLAAVAARLRGAADGDVSYVRSIFVPEDETCFHVLAGPSREAIDGIVARAAIAYERIVEAVTTVEKEWEG